MRKMKKLMILMAALLILMTTVTAGVMKVKAANTEDTAAVAEQEESQDNTVFGKAIGAAIAIGLSAAAGAIAMGIAIAKSNEGVARQPEAAGKIQTQLMLGLVFIETAIIYSLIVAILIIFVM